MKTPTRIWQQRVVEHFENVRGHVFMRQQLADILATHGEEFGVPASTTLRRFIDTLSTAGRLRAIEIISETDAIRREESPSTTDRTPDEKWAGYRPFHRFAWGDEISPNEVALSLRPRSYLSHASAVFLHALTRQIVRTVYVNTEQTPKPAPQGGLTQRGIDFAFRQRPRTSQYVFLYEKTRLVLLNGKSTGNLEVSDIAGSAGMVFQATKLERTLIDISVRPTYAGGVFEVLEAFRGAKERASVATLLATLRHLDYIYPYHQALGFYLERAGYSSAALERVEALGAEYDFYLTHQIPNPQYDRRWKIYYPEGL